MQKMSAPGRHTSGRHSRPAEPTARPDGTPGPDNSQGHKKIKWQGPALNLLLAITAAGVFYFLAPGPGAFSLSGQSGVTGISMPNVANLLGHGEANALAPLPAPIVMATASASPTRAKATQKAKPGPVHSDPTTPVSTAPTNGSGSPVGGANYAGSLV